MARTHVKLGQGLATAICGNDILSSTLYVSGIAVIFAGVYAPLVLVIIALILYFYKSVYTEVVEALPINGGAYNCLLNGTSKTIAAVAGVTTILSYIATCVLSAKVGVEYISTILPLPILPTVIALLLFFAILVIFGLKDSARIAFGIFTFHIITLVTFVLLGVWYFLNPHTHNFLMENMTATQLTVAKDGILQAIFFGFAASLLGVSGFESSANFVEEQQPGVFRKTLRNMLIGVAIFNPLIAFVILNVSSMQTIIHAKDFLLADEAMIIGGNMFRYVVAIDAFLVLSGAILTSFIGVSGLVYRMASDACLPDFLTKQNKKGSYPLIIISFFVLCTSILLLTGGNLLSLAGVYTIAFLGVMTLFAFGNLILRETRSALKRTYTAPVAFVVLAFLATAIGIVANIQIDPKNFLYFSLYFFPAVLFVLAIVYQDYNVGVLLRLTRHIPPVYRFFQTYFEDITQGKLVAFINHVNRLYPILEYINRNETARHIVLVHCKNWDMESDRERHNEIKQVIPYLQKAGVFTHFTIELMYVNEPFGPKAIDQVSKNLKVRKNRIMIGSIHHFHEFDYEDLGGVRIII